MYLKTKILTVLAAGAVIATVGVAPASAAPPVAERAPITQVAHEAVLQAVTGTASDGRSFEGTITDLVATLEDGEVIVSGLIDGTLTDVDGVTEDILTTFEAVLPTQPAGACEILSLDLGPLDLDVLGLVIELDPVVLDITAVPGAGNLLGNLLCAVAGLLDRDGPLTAVTNLLNRLFDALDLAA